MDWPRDDDQVSQSDRKNVFKCTPGSGHITIAHSLNGGQMERISCEAETDTLEWLNKRCPQPDGSTFGWVVLMPRRGGQPLNPEQASHADAHADLAYGTEAKNPTRATPPTFKDFQTLTRHRGGLRTWPCTHDTFRTIAQRFFIHANFARTVSRGDIPAFTASEVKMGHHPAWVVTLRTTSAWGMDLAMTCTFFPHCMLAFSIILGCTPSIEADVLKRLALRPEDTVHPLLVPGIVVELERLRYSVIVDHSVDKLESRILDLDIGGLEMHDISDIETARTNGEKRDDWLDMSYLRNQLVGWGAQLSKMASWAEEKKSSIFQTQDGQPIENLTTLSVGRKKQTGDKTPPGLSTVSTMVADAANDTSILKAAIFGRDVSAVSDAGDPDHEGEEVRKMGGQPLFEAHGDKLPAPASKEETGRLREDMRQLGPKFVIRIREIKDECDDKIRECTMRLEGMTMASQWAEGETNVQIALEMRRDSRHMRSIALVTMVFLPGTFFASVFSMTFFNWSQDSNTDTSNGPSGNTKSESIVSIWVLLWVGFTLFATGATFAFWWYFVVYREAKARRARAKAVNFL